MGEFRRQQFASKVLANRPLCREHFRLVLGLPSFPPTDPGQFVQVACRDLGADEDPEVINVEWEPGRPLPALGGELQGPLAFLRRPFSLAGRRDTPGGVELDVIHRVVGMGTQWLAELKPGDAVYLLGPLGNRFSLPPEGGEALLVGGGVGIPPMLYLAERLAGRRAVAFSGALTRDLLPLTITASEGDPTGAGAEPRQIVDEFSRYGIPSVVTTDDGSYGFRGFVTQALERYLDRHVPPSVLSPQSPVLPTVYTCGPEPMMKRVADIAASRGLDCQIAVERAMACGMGTCQSCCIKVKRPPSSQGYPDGRDWVYRLACTDGPVFRGADLLW